MWFLYPLEIKDGHHCLTSFNIWPYWKIDQSFFLETTNMIEPRLHEWLLHGPIQSQYFCVCMYQKSKMVTLVGPSFTIGSYGKIDKYFFSETTILIKPKTIHDGLLDGPNKVAIFYVDQKSKMATTATQI